MNPVLIDILFPNVVNYIRNSLCAGNAHIPDKEKTMKKYICDVCGWVYDPATGAPADGVAAGTPWESVADDFVCPECGAGKSLFVPKK